jgi:hypothetical protein
MNGFSGDAAVPWLTGYGTFRVALNGPNHVHR